MLGTIRCCWRGGPDMDDQMTADHHYRRQRRVSVPISKGLHPTRSLGIGRCDFLGNSEVNDGKRSLGLAGSGASLPPSTYFACSRCHIIVFRRHGMRRLYRLLCPVVLSAQAFGQVRREESASLVRRHGRRLLPGWTRHNNDCIRRTERPGLRAQDLRTGNGRAAYGRL